MKNIIRTLTVLILISIPGISRAQVSLHYEENQTPTWEEVIGMYTWLDSRYKEARLIEAGTTDAGKPLHLFIISKDRLFTPEEARKAGKRILFINNGIHPGESCGIDASLKFADDLLSGREDAARWLKETVICIVPVFNVGGALNRSPFNRANQNGPEEHGFRANACNLDLNRDFIKLDSDNARSMVRLLQAWKPDLFIDTHTSDGADYPYCLTLIASQPQKMEAAMSSFQQEKLLPWLYSEMKKTPYEMIPYVANFSESPEQGIEGFMDYPRYTSGYAALFNTFAFTTETHMFKPYRDRVLATWYFLRSSLIFTGSHSAELEAVRKESEKARTAKRSFVIEWAADTSRYDSLFFRGYEARHRTSAVTGAPRLYYDRSSTWEKYIPYYNYYLPVKTVEAPRAYVIPRGWDEVIDRLRLNGVKMTELDRDTLLPVTVYYIDSESTSTAPYNGHYWHYDTRVKSVSSHLQFYKGDLVIQVQQPAAEYIVQTLEPEAYDSFFSWNFFDAVLSRKEYFSSYIFEETAERLLLDDPELAREFRDKQQSDSLFASNPRQQLTYIYEHSPYSEKTYRRYPVARIE
ncbi:MAG: M14 family zinc carboxypeptidase [Bacteroidota bacterium]